MSSKLLVPFSIIIAGGIIAFAIFSGPDDRANSGRSSVSDGNFGNSFSGTAQSIRPVEAGEHIRGNPDALVTVVEFSDFECPFCRRLHPTLTGIIEEFDGQVRWVYRHFPLTSIHSQAQAAAVASECVASLGGNNAFWEFTDLMFDNQSRLGDGLYREFVRGAGIDEDEFNACLDSGEAEGQVAQDLQDATSSGGRGTPYVVVINADGKLFPFSGALPYAQIRSIIQQALGAS